MPQVSKRPLDKTVAKKMYEIFLEALLGLKNRKEAYQFIYDLLTPTERIMLAKRLSIVLMLIKGYKREEIRDTLRVSTSTVFIIKMWLRLEGKGYRQVLEKVLRKEKLKSLWYKIDYYLKGSMPGVGGSKEDFRKIYREQYESQPIETPLGDIR